MTDKKIKDGGAAFPNFGGINSSLVEDYGMSVRDYFASKAMQGFCADPTNHKVFADHADAARNAYEIADAMLKARGD